MNLFFEHARTHVILSDLIFKVNWIPSLFLKILDSSIREILQKSAPCCHFSGTWFGRACISLLNCATRQFIHSVMSTFEQWTCGWHTQSLLFVLARYKPKWSFDPIYFDHILTFKGLCIFYLRRQVVYNRFDSFVFLVLLGLYIVCVHNTRDRQLNTIITIS